MFVSSLFNKAYSIITNKDDLANENATIKQVLKENVYEESIISEILRKLLTIMACLSHNIKRKPQISKKVRSK